MSWRVTQQGEAREYKLWIDAYSYFRSLNPSNGRATIYEIREVDGEDRRNGHH